MSIRDLAYQDNRLIHNDLDGGFGWPVQVINPQGQTASMSCLSTDVSLIIDPDTQAVVSGRKASACFNLQDFLDINWTWPTAVADERVQPWLVRFTDIAGNLHTFRISQSDPDRALGEVVCHLELVRGVSPS